MTDRTDESRMDVNNGLELIESLSQHSTTASADLSLEDLVKCSICYETFTEPRFLPCSHCFCFSCLTHIARNHIGLLPTCPLCRKEFSVPDGEISNLPRNIYLEFILHGGGDSAEVENPSTGATLCDVCGDSRKPAWQCRAMWYCGDCEQYLCNSCYQCHIRLKATETHNTVSMMEVVEGGGERSKTRFCERHEQKIVDLWCRQCKQVACAICYVSLHNGHPCALYKEMRRVGEGEGRGEGQQQQQQQQQRRELSPEIRRFTGFCFRCHWQGHRAVDCPQQFLPENSPPMNQRAAGPPVMFHNVLPQRPLLNTPNIHPNPGPQVNELIAGALDAVFRYPQRFNHFTPPVMIDNRVIRNNRPSHSLPPSLPARTLSPSPHSSNNTLAFALAARNPQPSNQSVSQINSTVSQAVTSSVSPLAASPAPQATVRPSDNNLTATRAAAATATAGNSAASAGNVNASAGISAATTVRDSAASAVVSPNTTDNPSDNPELPTITDNSMVFSPTFNTTLSDGNSINSIDAITLYDTPQSSIAGSSPQSSPGSNVDDSTSPGTQSSSPGSQSTSPGSQSTSSGSQSTSPGSQSTSPGSQSTSPGSQSTSSGSQSTSPGSQSTSPGTQSTSPGSQSTSPGSQSTSPGSQSTSPGSQSTSPGSQSTSPGSHTRSVRCRGCGSRGHISRDCVNKQQCRRCGMYGHKETSCGRVVRETLCYQCNVYGHVAQDCPTTYRLRCVACNRIGQHTSNCRL